MPLTEPSLRPWARRATSLEHPRSQRILSTPLSKVLYSSSFPVSALRTALSFLSGWIVGSEARLILLSNMN